MRISFTTRMLAMLACLLAAGPAWADEPKASDAPEETTLVAPDALQDKDFEKFVGAVELAAAGLELDPDVLSEVAEKLSAGERALARPPAHGITSDATFKMALMAAFAKRDAKTLERLEAQLLKLKKTSLAERAKAMRRLAAAKRDAAPALTVTVDELIALSPDVLADFQATIQDLKAAQIAGDRKALDLVKEHVQSDNGWLAKQKEYADKLIAAIAAEIPEDADPELVEAAAKLVSASRGFPRPSPPPGPRVTSRSYSIVLMNALRAPAPFVVTAGSKTVRPVVQPNGKTTLNVLVSVDTRSGQWMHPVVVSLANVPNSSMPAYSAARFVVNPDKVGKPKLIRVQ